MADIKISAMTNAATVNATDLTVIDQAGTTVSMTITQLNSIEATARAAADTTLTNNLATEATSRASADSTLTTAVGVCIQKNGTVAFTANQPMGSNKFTGLAAGTTSGDSVRYEQVLLLAGGTMSGVLNMGGQNITGLATPEVNSDATTKAYVLGLTINSLAAPTGSFAMNANKITGLADPTLAQDAVTINYLISQASWNLDANSTSSVVGATLPLVLSGGTATKYQVFTTGVSTTGSITPTVVTGVDSNFELFFKPFSLGNDVLTITGGMPYGAGNHLTQKQTFINSGGTYSAFVQPAYIYSASQLTPDMFTRWYSVLYDFSVNGGAISTITLAVAIPPASFIVGAAQAIIECITAATSGGSATISWGLTGGQTSTTQFDTAVAFNAAPYSQPGLMRLGTIGSTTKFATESFVTITIVAAALTAGKFWIHIPVLVNR